MMEKRRLSTRNRGEPPLKKRALTPPAPPAPPRAAPALPPPPAEPIIEGLPTKLRDGQPLPTLPGPQDSSLSDKAYQTVSESGVLAASIERSRQKWLNGSLFELYWAKPRGKKGVVDAPNPAMKSMTKLGLCSMIVEPHVFEIGLYTVKEMPVPAAPTNTRLPSLSAPQYNPFPPYPYPSAYDRQPSVSSHPYPQQAHPPQNTLPPFREGFAQFGPQRAPPVYHPPLPAMVPQSSSLSRSENTSSDPTQSQSRPEEPKADPVIQMLATRAASDPNLKTLMKIVASGKASPVQLKDFQDHIDELNVIIKSRPNQCEHFENGHLADPSGHTRQERQSKIVAPSPVSDTRWNQTVSTTTFPPTHPVPAPVKLEPTSQTQPITAPAADTRPFVQPKPEVNTIVFDIVGGTGDRFSFPRFSILEYLYGGTQVVASFLIIRQGKLAVSGKYKDTKYYYQPTTIRLTTNQPKVLEPLSRIVAPLDEVRNYMNNIFEKYPRAEAVSLAMRLPRTADTEDVQKGEIPAQADVHLTKAVYPPPDSIFPLATKASTCST
ncbi:hypothetical protein P7C71_g4830, partial [Lecanoromycetidae sp. Uapishka_2]